MPAMTPNERKELRGRCECEMVETRAIVYYDYTSDGNVIIVDVVVPRDQLYQDLLETLTDPDDHECSCEKFEINPHLEEWMDNTHPEWTTYVDDDFYCWCCKYTTKCHKDWLEKGASVEDTVKELYPAPPADTCTIVNIEVEDKPKDNPKDKPKKVGKPFSEFIEVGGKNGQDEKGQKAAKDDKTEKKGKATGKTG